MGYNKPTLMGQATPLLISRLAGLPGACSWGPDSDISHGRGIKNPRNGRCGYPHVARQGLRTSGDPGRLATPNHLPRKGKQCLDHTAGRS